MISSQVSSWEKVLHLTFKWVCYHIRLLDNSFVDRLHHLSTKYNKHTHLWRWWQGEKINETWLVLVSSSFVAISRDYVARRLLLFQNMMQWWIERRPICFLFYVGLKKYLVIPAFPFTMHEGKFVHSWCFFLQAVVIWILKSFHFTKRLITFPTQFILLYRFSEGLATFSIWLQQFQ